MLICKMMRDKMQFVLDEMEFYIRDAVPHEREMFLEHTKKYGIVNVISLFLATCTIIGFIMGPLILPQSFPTEAKYPFSVDTHPLYDIIYIQQSTVGIQVIAMTAIDCQMSMMLWYIVFRIKILQKQTLKVKNAYEFSIFVQKHEYLLWLANEITNIVRYILLTTVSMTTLSIIMGGVHIVGNQPMIEKMQFTFVVSAYASLVFLNAWPSEILMRSCEGIGTAIYESEWIGGNFNKDLVFVIQRCERPPVITIAGFLPILSLNYYTKFLSKTLSFFTTLRIVLAKLEPISI
uniref:Olfactory receptor 47 n=1 Tax=Meteorus pulchricornis TaxID=51522 RepID=A0A1S5VFN6_9HYME|nr:olfactory receptor 47 [Meteorus pulchricornis]